MGEKNVGSTGYKETEIGMIPEDWEVVNIGDVCDFSRGVSWKNGEVSKSDNGIPVITIPNIKENGKIDYNIKYYVKKSINDTKLLKRYDILLVGSSGSLKNIGRNAIIQYLNFPKVTYASFLIRARTKSEEIVNNEYLYYIINSSVVNFANFSRRASDGKYNFQLTLFKKEQKIPLPPLDEQKKISEILTAIDKKIEVEENKKKALEELFKSMLHNLMTGKIRVKDLEVI